MTAFSSRSSFSWKQNITVHLVRSLRARRYLLRLEPDGSARLVIPRRGSSADALLFLERSEAWLLRRREQWRLRPHLREPWQDGSLFFFRGEEIRLRVEQADRGIRVSFADLTLWLAAPLPDYRTVILAQLRCKAMRELTIRTYELARLHGVMVRRVMVRAQKTRWGSCSAQGTISLNWRLIQAPPRVIDYLIVHELMHRREMNHSARYWKLVADAFPDYRQAEAWLKKTRLETLC